MKIKYIRGIIGLIMLIGLIGLNLHASETQRRKARYYYTQGSLESAANNIAEAYEYFKKAYEIDTTYRDAAFSYGNQRMFLRTDTMQSGVELKKSMGIMQSYVDDNPSDLYSARMYGFVSTAMDTIEEAVRVLERTYSLLPAETDILLQLADSYMRIMQGKEALNAMERYEAIEGKSKDLSLKKVTVMLAIKDTLGAVEEVKALIESNPRDPYSRILKGNLYEVMGEMDSVFNAYREAQLLAPDNGAVKMSLANYYRAAGDSVMLDNMMYEALLSEEFELEEKLGILGDYLQKLIDEAGDKSRGDHLFKVLQEQYPHEPDVQDMAARYAAAKGDFEGASEAIRYAIDMDPVNEQYWVMLLSFDITQSKYDDAVRHYQIAGEHLDPSLKMKNLYAAAASLLENKNEAEQIINGLLTLSHEGLNPKTSTEESRKEARSGMDYDNLVFVSSLYCMLGDLYYKNGDLDKGIEEYEKSLYFFSDNALTLNNYAYFLSEADRDLEKAKTMSKRTLELVDNNPTYYDTYAWVLYKLGEYKEAMEYMNKALEIAEEIGDDNEEYNIHYRAIKEALGE